MKDNYQGPERRQQAWHLDKKVTLALIFLLLGQMGSTIWWAAEINGATRENANATTHAVQRLSEMEARERDGNKLVERVVRVETMLENVQTTVNRIDNAVYSQPKTRGAKP